MTAIPGGVKPVLVNFYERATDRLLTSTATRTGDRLLTKVRLADAIDVDGLTGRLSSMGWLVISTS
jgi:hypothetical protein